MDYSPNEGKEEIIISICSVEENIRKLYEASKSGSIQTLKTLIQEDPNLIQKILTSSATSNLGSPLHVSISHGRIEFARLLLDHKPELAVEVDAFRKTPLHLASMIGEMEIVKALLEKNTSACLAYDENVLIPLHYAVISGKIEIMKELINARPQTVWMKLNNGQTILHLCVESKYFEGIVFLIERFFNHDDEFLNKVDGEGNTILDLSIMQRQREMVGYLLSIPKVKTNAKERTESRKAKRKTKIRYLKRQKQAQTSLFSKKTIKRQKKNRKYKGDMIGEVQGIMMLVATVIATVTFEAGINPPGGVWQQDTQYIPGNYTHEYSERGLYNNLRNGTIFPAGTSVMAYQQRISYVIYFISNMVSFLASVSVILLVVSRFPVKNKVGSVVLVLTMCVAVVFLAIGYLVGVNMVSVITTDNIVAMIGYFSASFFWIAIVGLIGLYYVIRFLIWVIKSLFRTISKYICCLFPSSHLRFLCSRNRGFGSWFFDWLLNWIRKFLWMLMAAFMILLKGSGSFRSSCW